MTPSANYRFLKQSVHFKISGMQTQGGSKLCVITVKTDRGCVNMQISYRNAGTKWSVEAVEGAVEFRG